MDATEKLAPILERTDRSQVRIAIPEATDDAMLPAAAEVYERGLGQPVLVGDPAKIAQAAEAYGVALDGLEIFDFTDEAVTDELIELYSATSDLFSVKALHRKAAEPLNYAMMMLQVGWVDCCFGGVAYTSGDFIAAARGLIGLSEGVRSPSSLGFHYVPGWEGGEDGMVAIGDCSTTIAPTPEQLAGIAIASCDTARTLFGWEPRAAMLSFSTCGSGHHEKADQVREAVGIANELRPDLAIDGEFQLDAAINPRVAARKVKRESKVAGRANILIFPDINAGNIGWKLMQEFGHSEVACLVMQGFAKPVADCSRGDTPHILANSMACLAARAERGMN